MTVRDKKEGKGLNTESTERGGTELTEKRPESGDQRSEKASLPAAAFEDSKHHIKVYQGDCLEILAKIPDDTVDLVFADPPYFLSNGGITCHAGRMVSVNKGEWDKSRGAGLGPVRARFEKSMDSTAPPSLVSLARFFFAVDSGLLLPSIVGPTSSMGVLK